MLRDDAGQPVSMTGININIDAQKAAAFELQESERLFRTLANSVPQLTWMSHADGNRFWCSERWYAYTGTSPEQNSGFGWQSLIHPQQLPALLEKWRACTISGQPFSFEYGLKGADGNYRSFLKLATPLLDPEARVTRWIGTDTDITQIEESREALREGESQFRQITDSMPQLVWVTDPNGDIVWRNHRWQSYAGKRPEDESWDETIHPDDLATARESWRVSLQTGEPLETASRVRRRDGAYRWFLVRSMPVRDSHGKIVKWFGTCTDIEDYKQAESQIQELNDSLEQRVRERTAELAAANDILAETQSRLQGVLDSATRVCIIGTDPAGFINIFNRGAERALQFRAEEVLGHSLTQLLHSEAELANQSAMLSQKLGRPIHGFDVFREPALLGVFDECEWTYLRKDRTTLEVSLAVSVVRNAAGAVTGFLCTAMDISAQKSLERKLREKNADLVRQTQRAEEASLTKSAFVASMSHEIRTPMNAILGMSDLLWESDLSSDQRQYVEVFQRAGNVLLDLINSVLDLSKIESGHLELENTYFDLDDVIARTVELLAPKATAKEIALLYRIAPSVPSKVVGDAVRLQQILVNLVGNAVKFTESGEVVLTVQPSQPEIPGCLEFSISDTGIGLSPEQLETVFDDFSQADASTTRKYGGTGLGLGICRRLIASMGGQLHATSELGKGSTFRFNVVLQAAEERRAAPRSQIRDLQGLGVLLIDNNATNRLILRETLMSWGLQSMECGGAEEAAREIVRAKACNEAYSIILLDRHMPNMDGFAAIPLLRLADPNVPIVMLTSDNRPGDADRRAAARLSGYAIKPVKRADLLRIICNALGTAAPPAPVPLVPSPDPQVPEATAILRILIAEDSPDNRLLLHAYLKQGPYLLTFAENGVEAVDKFQAAPFDLVLMDMQMPLMDGLAATRAIRAFECSQNRTPVPIVALTAAAMAQDSEASLKAGCDAHLSKPISRQRLLGALGDYGKAFPILVEAPETLEGYATDYLHARTLEVPELLHLLAASDFEGLRKKGHDLRGSGASFGFSEITVIGEALETSARSRNRDGVTLQLQKFGDYLNRVQVVSRPASLVS